MKKLLALPLIGLITASAVCGCGPSKNDATPSDTAYNSEGHVSDSVEDNIEYTPIPGETRAEDVLDEFFAQSPFHGIIRRFGKSLGGTYYVEYVHTPYRVDKDDTLDYRITLNDDNTYTMTAVVKGVTSEHYGHWYSRADSITLFYDEPIDDIAHNEYYSDCMYCELLEGNKIMLYDNGHTVVLSRDIPVYEK